jgi:hypothetical protein
MNARSVSRHLSDCDYIDRTGACPPGWTQNEVDQYLTNRSNTDHRAYKRRLEREETYRSHYLPRCVRVFKNLRRDFIGLLGQHAIEYCLDNQHV